MGAQAALIGGTAFIALESLSALCPGCEVWAKAEHLNPSGTGKDRIALAMLAAAEAEGSLPYGGGGVVVEGSSGSTAIALAPLALAAGHRVVAVLPDDVSDEKVAELRAFPNVDARLARASSISSPTHYANEARRIARDLRAAGERAVCTDQFENDANWRAHHDGTAREIWDETRGRFSAFVASAGTGGTIAGASHFFKARDPGIKVYLADPQGSSLFSRVRYGVCYATQQRERVVRRHRYDTIVDGVGLDRVTANFSRAIIDDALTVSDADALVMAHYLLRFEGLFLGSSSALNCLAAVRVANRIRETTTRRVRVVTILCDSGHRYFSRFWNRDFVERRGLAWPPDDAAALREASLETAFFFATPDLHHFTGRAESRAPLGQPHHMIAPAVFFLVVVVLEFVM
ncbi:hypothetical protein CTAYLR_003886 [Chrysophaeum taylorii]|uniref:Tryptophan synthase beta chain-like PALP domain-containing protein n=1 Tax=Chrysophaeum taylorii TaxID=2483200 RepID=A0AAD7UKG7_9STRA|nr:hypothetical protein CTAYLR_003886 [Chrysophaeum taylorii]